MQYLWGYLIGYGFLFAIILGTGAAYKIFKLPSEVSRKIIHISICFTWIVIYKFFAGSWQCLVMPVSFIIINALSLKYHFFKGMEREGEKSTPGTVYYAMAITILFAASLIWPQTLIPGGIATFCLSFGDGFAALFGEFFGKRSPKITKSKSLVGSLACIIFSVIGIYILSLFVPINLELYEILIIGLASAILELVGYGFDNFSITIGVTILATLMSNA
jgi:dolichol kinase